MNQHSAEYYEEHKDMYERKPRYSGLGWFVVSFIGMSALPTRIEFYDKETGVLAATFNDDKTRKKYVGRF